MDVKTGILITGGEKSSLKQFKEIIKKDWIIGAADSGLEWAVEAGLDLSFCIGDMDSLRDETILCHLDEDQIHRFPVEKDFTDTELGIQKLKDMNCRKIIIWGAGGGRMDHFLAVYALFERPEGPDEWYTAREHMIHIKDEGYSDLNLKGKRISLFPLGTEVCRMKSSGLKWPLDQLVWKKGDFGLSNVIESELKITIESGRLLMVYDIEEGNRP